MRFYTTQSALRFVAITFVSTLLVSCGQGDGPSGINDPLFATDPVSLSLPVKNGFEDPGAITITDFGGGAAAIVDNPVKSPGARAQARNATRSNNSAKVGQMKKFAGENYGGATITLPDTLDFTDSEVLTILVWASRKVDLTFKLEGPTDAGDREVIATHSGSSKWEELVLDFSGMNPPDTKIITLIFDNGIMGDAAGNPSRWTFYFDDLAGGAGTGGGGGGGGGGGELITNGTFEAGDTTGWALVENAGTFTATMDQAASGLWSGNLVASVPGGGGPASFPVASQNNIAVGTVTPGQAVTVSFDICGEVTGAGGVVQTALLSEIAGGGASATDQLFGNITPTGTWQNYSMTTLSGADVTGGITLQLKSDCGGNPGCTVNAFFDNVSVVLDSDVGNPSNAGGACSFGGGGPTEPVAAAPTPTLDPLDVIAVFSDAYPIVLGPGAVNYDPDWGQATDATTVMIAGNETLKYAGLNYQGTDFGGPQDLTAAGMTNLHVDFWTADSTALNVYVIGAGEFPVALTPDPGNWVSVDIPLTDFTGVDMSQAIQFKFDGNGTIFLDNLYFSCDACGGGNAWPTTPTTAAPTPMVDAGDVLSIFSDAYTPAVTADFNPNWGQSTVTTTETIVGNATLKYAGLNYQGTTWEGTPLDLTAAGMTHLHVDFWTVDSTALNVYVIGAGEFPVALTPKLAKWVSVDIPLTDFIGVDMSQAIQFKFDGNGTVFLDNLYFFKSSGGGVGGEIAVNGGLESGLTGWEATPNGGTSELSSAEAHTGSNSARVRADVAANGGGASFPDIKLANAGVGVVTNGQALTVSFWTKTVEQTGAVPFFAQLFTEQSGGGASKTDFLIQPPTFLTTGDWQEHTFNVTLGPDASAGVSLLFKADCGATPGCVLDVFIDDVSIVPN